MKPFKLISAAFVLAAILLSGCKDDEEYGIDASKAAPEEVTFDESNSSATVLAVYWNAKQAIAAGAASFTVQATPTENGGDNYDTSVSQTLASTATVNDAATFSNLAAGVSYYLRVRANYPNSVYSSWVYVSENNEPKLFQVTLAAPVLSNVIPSSETISFSWAKVTSATSYSVEYKISTDSEWTVVDAGDVATYEIKDLKSETSYDVRLQATMSSGAVKSAYSEVSTVSTLVKAPFPKEIGTAAELVSVFASGDLLTAGATDVVELTADIDMSGKTLTTVAKFSGIFKGNNHSIKNWNGTNAMFNINAGTIQEVVIDATSSFTPSEPIFGVIANNNTGKIADCINKAKVNYSVDNATVTILVAGIAAQSSGEISGCSNNGEISVSSATGLLGTGVSGIAAYVNGPIKNCTNNGKIIMTSLYTADKSTAVGDYTTTVPCEGGLVAFAGIGFTMDGCDNHGAIHFTQTQIDKYTGTKNLNRHLIGGLVGATAGDISNSNNFGTINVVATNSTAGTAYSAKEYNFCIGGLGGGDYFPSGQNSTNYSNCKNEAEGDITVNCDASKSNSTVGGIVGWPGVESSKQTVVTTNCSNAGDITVSGASKIRVGGVQGGTGFMKGCSNTGTLTINSANSASVLGSLCGFHSQAHSIEDCVAGGKVVGNCDLDGVGGLIGNNGNATNTTGTGCSVNCSITATAATVNVGLIVGKFNGTSYVVTLGSTDSPIKVKGSVNGTVITSGNYTNYLVGATNVSETSHVIYASFDE